MGSSFETRCQRGLNRMAPVLKTGLEALTHRPFRGEVHVVTEDHRVDHGTPRDAELALPPVEALPTSWAARGETTVPRLQHLQRDLHGLCPPARLRNRPPQIEWRLSAACRHEIPRQQRENRMIMALKGYNCYNHQISGLPDACNDSKLPLQVSK